MDGSIVCMFRVFGRPGAIFEASWVVLGRVGGSRVALDAYDTVYEPTWTQIMSFCWPKVYICTKESMGFFLEVSILKGEIMSFYIQDIDQNSSQNLSKTFQKILRKSKCWCLLRRLGGDLCHIGHLGASWGILAGCIPRSSWASWPSWWPLGSVLGASWAVLGRLFGHLGASRGVWEAS